MRPDRTAQARGARVQARWRHDTGYGPAYRHEGLTVAVRSADRVIGWKSGCGCGWRGTRTYDRERFPSESGAPPAEVDGSATRTGAFSEWRFHLFEVVPELVVADTVNVVLRSTSNLLTNPLLAAVVAAAREHGATWPRIADAAGVTLREARWA